jgi:hypothetical protein
MSTYQTIGKTDIIDCDGAYEVHPASRGGYAVVNSETGDVRCSFTSCDEAVALARSLNTTVQVHRQSPRMP